MRVDVSSKAIGSLLVALALFLTACNQPAPNAPATTPEDYYKGKTVTIEVRHGPVVSTTAGSGKPARPPAHGRRVPWGFVGRHFAHLIWPAVQARGGVHRHGHHPPGDGPE